MMGWNGGFGWIGWLGPVVMVLFWVGVLGLGVWLLRALFAAILGRLTRLRLAPG